MIDQEKIKRIVEEGLQDGSVFVTDIIVKSGNRILIYIDGDQYVTVGDCAFLSKYVESRLNRDQEDFELHVSSAGADQVLKFPRQYPKNIGKKLEVVCTNGEKLIGVLLQAGENGITLAPDTKKRQKTMIAEPVGLTYGEIERAKCIISFK
ncbi:MAG: ribosome assembly cofactor RimP [Bacteroidales bacterium]|nr:ribosome assembly cofactor RimP [Bacteroidales bacterium]MDZ4205275.1 ribosome assembly cofactor RimP [Bacteroidales bacterium]